MRKTRRCLYAVRYGNLMERFEATSYGNAVALFRRKHRTPHLGSDSETGGFIGYHVETPADRRAA